MNERDSLDVAKLRRRLKEEADRGSEASARESPDKTPLSPLASRIAAQLRQANHSPSIILGQFGLLEAISLAAIHLLSNAFLFGAGLDWLRHGVMLPLAILTFVLINQVSDGYQVHVLRRPAASIGRAMAALAIVTFLLVLIAALWSDDAALFQWLLTDLGLCAGFVAIERYLVALSIRRWTRNGFMERRAVIVGGGAPAKQFIRLLESQEDNDIRICGIFDDRKDERSPKMVAGYPKLGTFAELVAFAREARIDMLIISLPLSAEARILQLLKTLWVLPVDIRMAAHAEGLQFRPRSSSRVDAAAMVDIIDRPIQDWDSVAKRIFDIGFSLLAIALLWPVMLGAALAVKFTSKGPIIFVQKRHGFNNEVINVLKFRSMYTEMSDPTARLAVTKNDPRVTPVGRFLRKSSIDELPQLFNVLRGDLSLVGPRPHAVLAQTHDRLYGDIVESYFARHRVKPGVTGWAQINGWRGEVDCDEKIKGRTAYDLYYIENWSLLLDLKILFLTPIRLLNVENAY